TCLQDIKTTSAKEGIEYELENLKSKKVEIEKKLFSQDTQISKKGEIINQLKKSCSSKSNNIYYISNEISRLKKEIESNENQLKKIEEIIEKETPNELYTISKNDLETNWTFTQPFNEIQRARTNEMNNILSNWMNELYSINADEKASHTLLNQYTNDIKQIEDSIKHHEETLKKEEEAMSQKQEIIKLLDFWEIGFDKKPTKAKMKQNITTMRSYLLSQSIEDLN